VRPLVAGSVTQLLNRVTSFTHSVYVDITLQNKEKEACLAAASLLNIVCLKLLWLINSIHLKSYCSLC